MIKRKTWNKRIKYCKKCKGYQTKGGFKFKLFGFWTIKLTEYKQECKCTRYAGETELDKEKCEEVLKKQEEDKNDEK